MSQRVSWQGFHAGDLTPIGTIFSRVLAHLRSQRTSSITVRRKARFLFHGCFTANAISRRPCRTCRRIQTR